ncbi:NAC domain-containing protein 71-like [Pistacia vera]|uniref:NAC domain-containing protein 71-like n=1 Tax=Pistacia vera TaxID=55513 RepID=UPI0012637BA5|nr:NAC domain-containing protein 71-like [Pistacia vera]
MVSSSFLPPGYNFCPTDGDLIGHDLHNKVFGLPLSSDIVKDCDLYGSREPWEIREFYRGEKGEDLYIFTPLKKKSSKRKRICRKVGWGAWQGEDVAQEIQDNRVTGHKKDFEALFPGLSTDNESANLGDLFPLDEQVQSAYSEKLSFSIETYASIDDEFSFHQGQEFFSSVFQLLSEPSSDYDFQIYSSYANEVTETETTSNCLSLASVYW